MLITVRLCLPSSWARVLLFRKRDRKLFHCILWSWTGCNGIGIRTVVEKWACLAVILMMEEMIKVIVVNSCFCPSCLSFTVTKLSQCIEFSLVIKESSRQSATPAHWLIYSKDVYRFSAPWTAMLAVDTLGEAGHPCTYSDGLGAAVTWALSWGWGESLKRIIAVRCPFASWINSRELSF